MVTHHHSLTKVLYKNVAVEQSFTGPITLKKKKKNSIGMHLFPLFEVAQWSSA